MQLKTFGAWASFATSVGAGALTANPDYQCLSLPVAIASGCVFAGLVGVYGWSNRSELARWTKMVEPSHVIICGLLIALGGAVWQSRRGLDPLSTKVGELEGQVVALKRQLEASVSSPASNKFTTTTPAKAASAEPAIQTKPSLSPRAVRELLHALNEAKELHSKTISTTMGQIASWAVNWRGVMRNGNGVELYSRLKQELKSNVWDRIDKLMEDHKGYQRELNNAFVLDSPVAKDELSRALQSAIQVIQRLPPNAPPEMDDLAEPQFKELAKQSDLGWQWTAESGRRIDKMIQNLNSSGTADYQ